MNALSYRSALAAVVVLSLAVISCAATPAAAGDPYIRGTITRVAKGSILVEENPSEESGSNKAMLRLTAETELATEDGRSISADELREGAIVTVWVDGPVMESYPVQATASRVVLQQK